MALINISAESGASCVKPVVTWWMARRYPCLRLYRGFWIPIIHLLFSLLFFFFFFYFFLFPFFSFSFFLFYRIYYFFCFIMKINKFIFSNNKINIYIYVCMYWYNRYTFGIVIQSVFRLKIFFSDFLLYFYINISKLYKKTTKNIINLICFLSQTHFLNAFKHDFNYKNKLPICFAFDYCLLLKIRSNISNRNV